MSYCIIPVNAQITVLQRSQLSTGLATHAHFAVIELDNGTGHTVVTPNSFHYSSRYRLTSCLRTLPVLLLSSSTALSPVCSPLLGSPSPPSTTPPLPHTMHLTQLVFEFSFFYGVHISNPHRHSPLPRMASSSPAASPESFSAADTAHPACVNRVLHCHALSPSETHFHLRDRLLTVRNRLRRHWSAYSPHTARLPSNPSSRYLSAPRR